MRIWLIEDDDDCAEAITETISDMVPEARITRFRDVRHIKASAGPAVALVDVSAVCPLSQSYMCGEYLWPFAQKYPGSSIIILSGLAEAVRESVLEIFQDLHIENQTLFVGLGSTFAERLRAALVECGVPVSAGN